MLLLNLQAIGGESILQAQSGALEVMDSVSLRQQFDYITEKTRIYEDYRAIREDVFRKLKKNSLDSLSLSRNKISELKENLNTSKNEIQTLNASLDKANEERDEAVKNKNSFSFIGISIHKVLYNSIMWITIGGLCVLLVFGFLVFKRNLSLVNHTKKDLKLISEEFETYRKTSRERYEQMVVKLHDEIRKLKESR